ncbi:MAG TPA: hypothetical protein VMU29_13250 [Smithella sp.]|nr:hypothetical protein [Smithella sp.]
MPDDSMIQPNDKEKFEKALATRNFEIELFWKRALFFWGFIAAAFIALAGSHSKYPRLAILLSCFGVVCSLCWTLANRGSKYWQENWETKVDLVGKNRVGDLFTKNEPIQDKGIWLSARKYSVSRLTIGLSDYTFLLWVSVLLYETISHVNTLTCPLMFRDLAVILYVLFTAVFSVLLICFSKSIIR